MIVIKTSKYRIKVDEETGEFIVISLGERICPYCGDIMRKRDTRLRTRKLPGGRKIKYRLNRLKCKNCGKLHTELPDFLEPYKQYDAKLIKDVVAGVVTEDDIEAEDYPCAGTMRNWRKQAKIKG